MQKGIYKAIGAIVAGVVFAWVLWSGYDYLLGKGLVCAFAGLVLVAMIVIRVSHTLSKKPVSGEAPFWKSTLLWGPVSGEAPFWKSTLLWGMAAAFLLAFPYFDVLRAIGLLPGIVFLVVFTSLVRAMNKSETTASAVLGIAIWCLVVWLWAEAGMDGFVVMPIDLPSEAQASPSEAGKKQPGGAVQFTSDGLANALETEIESLGSGKWGNYGQTEAAQIMVGDIVQRLFPNNPWYKDASAHPRQLTGLETSHAIFNTQIKDLPLSGIYHVLRYIRGKPIIEGQVLVGPTGLTLALRWSNYPMACFSADISSALDEKITREFENNSDKLQSDILAFVKDDRDRQPQNPDPTGCHPEFILRALSWLDVVPTYPMGGEERIANVTVKDVNSDSQLTELLHFAAIEAMSKLNIERLAHYYDNATKNESALADYEEALPGLIAEYIDAPCHEKPAVRERLVEVLIRIGGLKSGLDASNPVKPGLAEGAYELAKEISSPNTRVLARTAYHYLIQYQILKLTESTADSRKNPETQGLRKNPETQGLEDFKDAEKDFDPSFYGSVQESGRAPAFMGVLIFANSGYTQPGARERVDESSGVAWLPGLPA